MAVAVFEVHGIFKVVEGAGAFLPLRRFHQLSLAATALGRNHGAAQLLAHRHGAAELFQVVGGVHLRDHQAEGFIAVDQVVEHHLGAATHLHPRPTGGIEEGIAAIGALETIEPGCRSTASNQQPRQHQGNQTRHKGA